MTATRKQIKRQHRLQREEERRARESARIGSQLLALGAAAIGVVIPGGGSASVEIKYDNPGTYYFVCTFHAGQGGTLVVEQPATPERSPQ